MTPRSLFPFALSLLLLGSAGPATAQPTPPVDRFDLVLVGHSLTPAHQIALKTNPWRSNEWMPVSEDSSTPCAAVASLRVVPSLPTARFLGQDIRENYIALKITTARDGATGTLRAAYALPAADSLSSTSCNRLAVLIANKPATVRRNSVASYVRPRPTELTADAPFIDHLEAPIRHRKPGVMEVEWLEILFRSEN